jgi:hypothetical protein
MTLIISLFTIRCSSRRWLWQISEFISWRRQNSLNVKSHLCILSCASSKNKSSPYGLNKIMLIIFFLFEIETQSEYLYHCWVFRSFSIPFSNFFALFYSIFWNSCFKLFFEFKHSFRFLLLFYSFIFYSFILLFLYSFLLFFFWCLFMFIILLLSDIVDNDWFWIFYILFHNYSSLNRAKC